MTDWTDPAWRTEATAWAVARLAERGIAPTGDVEQPHVRFWSTVLRLPTSAGPVWLKANGGDTRYEAALLDALGRWVPDAVLAPLAVDAARGWSLQPDGGETLRALLDRDPDPAHWERMLAGYADLQRALAPRVADLLALGVPDARPERLPDLLDDQLAANPSDAVRAYRPEYRRLSAELAALGPPPTLQHDDLHDANVFAAGCRVFDWGDSCVAHPFASLLAVLRTAARRYDVGPGDPLLARLRDAYLEGWTDAYDRAALRRAVELAVRTAPVCRALAWRNALAGADEAAWREHGEAVPGWLAELLKPPTL